MSKIFKLGVIGNPIEHSLSPFIHSRFARYENISLDYIAYKVEEDNFNEFINDFFANSLSKGLNVTLPFKKHAAEISGSLSEEAKFIKAVNTIIRHENRFLLDSTDGKGFMEDLKSNKIDITGKNILIYGAGGAVESILYRIILDKPKSICIINRTQQKALRLVKQYQSNFQIESSIKIEVNYDVVINGSSAGLTGAFNPPGKIKTNNKTCFYDLNYSLDKTPFCKWASDYSSNVFDGIGMLVNQAAYSFQLWFDVFPETGKVLNDINSLKK
jgi:shikimate dehydrogenase